MHRKSQVEDPLSVEEQRRSGGIWLRELRQKCNLSQRQLAEKVDADYYTFISQLENGRGRIPPNRYEKWAKALNMPADIFVFNLMRFYNPITHRILFGDTENNPHRNNLFNNQ